LSAGKAIRKPGDGRAVPRDLPVIIVTYHPAWSRRIEGIIDVGLVPVGGFFQGLKLKTRRGTDPSPHRLSRHTLSGGEIFLPSRACGSGSLCSPLLSHLPYAFEWIYANLAKTCLNAPLMLGFVKSQFWLIKACSAVGSIPCDCARCAASGGCNCSRGPRGDLAQPNALHLNYNSPVATGVLYEPTR
jgi:hypothetical protein